MRKPVAGAQASKSPKESRKIISKPVRSALSKFQSDGPDVTVPHESRSTKSTRSILERTRCVSIELCRRRGGRDG
ncbi:hypothetical protein BaRGS_00010325 [Batillaria attramentaria]|uniref:Uncharacterized protein n=1 Tax=Batillaria attramentaria TaxID=370345 RepID=A0ABD0LFW4_9CAEN